MEQKFKGTLNAAFVTIFLACKHNTNSVQCVLAKRIYNDIVNVDFPLKKTGYNLKNINGNYYNKNTYLYREVI